MVSTHTHTHTHSKGASIADLPIYPLLVLFYFSCRCCPECNEVVQASRKFDLWKLPDILVIHLKRFSYDRYTHLTQQGYKQSIHISLTTYSYWRDKLDALVEFPVK